MSMFANKIKSTIEGYVPECPVCTKDIEPGSSEVCQTPTGLWIIHRDCIEFFNNYKAPSVGES
jgi:hypothetical protein